MTKTEKAVSWGLTGFFGFVCLAAAPQLSVGFFIKYGILSSALGFGITAISSAVGKAFPDRDYSYDASGSRTVHHHHYDDSSYTAPRQNNWWFLPGNSYSSRSTPSDDGTYVGSRREKVQQPSVTPPIHPSTPTFLGTRIEHVIPSYSPSAPPSNASHGTFLGSRTEKVNSYTPTVDSNAGGGFFSGFTSSGNSSPSATPSSGATHVGTRYEPV